MATITSFISGQQEHADLGGRVVRAENKLNFATTNVAGADVVQALKIPANALVDKVWTVITTAEGATATGTVGDGTTANGWDASININATAGTVLCSLEATDTYGKGKLYSTADTIDIVPADALDAAVVHIIAQYTILEK